MTVPGEQQIAVVPVVSDSRLLNSVTQLADKHRDTLGFLPASVFAQRAAAGHVLAAVAEQGELAGYVVFDVARGRIRLMQACASPRARRRGVARALLDHLVAAARERGHRRLSLETGAQPAFAAARTLYASAGFTQCDAFGDYAPSPNSVYMTLLVPPP